MFVVLAEAWHWNYALSGFFVACGLLIGRQGFSGIGKRDTGDYIWFGLGIVSISLGVLGFVGVLHFAST